MSTTLDGDYTDLTTIGVVGGRYVVSFMAESRKRTSCVAGDEVDVELDVDPECWPRLANGGLVPTAPRSALVRARRPRESVLPRLAQPTSLPTVASTRPAAWF